MTCKIASVKISSTLHPRIWPWITVTGIKKIDYQTGLEERKTEDSGEPFIVFPDLAYEVEERLVNITTRTVRCLYIWAFKICGKFTALCTPKRNHVNI